MMHLSLIKQGKAVEHNGRWGLAGISGRLVCEYEGASKRCGDSSEQQVENRLNLVWLGRIKKSPVTSREQGRLRVA